MFNPEYAVIYSTSLRLIILFNLVSLHDSICSMSERNNIFSKMVKLDMQLQEFLIYLAIKINAYTYVIFVIIGTSIRLDWLDSKDSVADILAITSLFLMLCTISSK